MLNITDIIARIEEVRNNHQLTAASFAARIGVQRSAISHILSGRNKPSLDFLMKIHDAFDEVNIEWLILGKASPPSQKNVSLFDSLPDEDKMMSDQVTPEPVADIPKIITSNKTKEGERPIEIIYIYNNGTFERFTQKN